MGVTMYDGAQQLRRALTNVSNRGRCAVSCRWPRLRGTLFRGFPRSRTAHLSPSVADDQSAPPGRCWPVCPCSAHCRWCWWQSVRIVLRRGSTPQEGYSYKWITHCNSADRQVLSSLLHIELPCKCSLVPKLLVPVTAECGTCRGHRGRICGLSERCAGDQRRQRESSDEYPHDTSP